MLYDRFRTGKGLGYSAHFIGNTLVLETAGKGHKKPQTHAVEFAFQSYQVNRILMLHSVLHFHRDARMQCSVMQG